MGRQLAVYFGMQSCVMAHVDEISFLRANTFRSRQRFRYALMRRMRLRMPYCFVDKKYPGVPRIYLREVEAGKPFSVRGTEILPVAVMHGRLPILGYRIGVHLVMGHGGISVQQRFKLRTGHDGVHKETSGIAQHFRVGQLAFADSYNHTAQNS